MLTRVEINFNNRVKKFIAINGVGNGPVGSRFCIDHTEDFKELKIPFSRLHDTEGQMGSGEFVNIHCIFKDFDADENDPKNYNFKNTDRYLKYIIDSGTKVFYRLGETIENNTGEQFEFPLKGMRNYTVVPKDFEKWARICEHIICHYNEGWADGFKWGLEYFEIWNEPENVQCWGGTQEQYLELYRITANHLKKCFGDTIKIGGPAACMIYEALDQRLREPLASQFSMYNNFTEKFLKYISSEATKAPLDFFSWHGYCSANPKKLITDIRIARELLDFYGFTKAESICDEWNCWGIGNAEEQIAYRKGVSGAAFVASAFTIFQQCGLDKAMYYDAEVSRASFCGLFDEYDGTRLKPYYAFAAFNEVKSGEYELECSSDSENVYALASENAIMVSNVSEKGTNIVLSFNGLCKTCKAEIYLLDEKHDLELVRCEYFTNKNGKIMFALKESSVILVKLVAPIQ